MKTPEFQNTVRIGSLIKTLWLTVGLLVGIHVVLTLVHYQVHELPWLVRQIFDVDEEDSFPTWYSASALLFTAMVLWINARAHRRAASPQTWPWYGLAGGFLLLSVDEIAGLHESLNSVTEISWAIPGGIFGLLIGGIYLKFLSQIDRKTAVQFVLGGAIFLGGAVGVELGTEPYLENDELNTVAYNLWTAVEEAMEMVGVLIFLKALLLSMKSSSPFMSLEFKLTD